jgi:hypothetical protein
MILWSRARRNETKMSDTYTWIARVFRNGERLFEATDDSGTRHPDHKPGKRAAHGYDWFALGGVMMKDSDEPVIKELHSTFCRKWGSGPFVPRSPKEAAAFRHHQLTATAPAAPAPPARD